MLCRPLIACVKKKKTLNSSIEIETFRPNVEFDDPFTIISRIILNNKLLPHVLLSRLTLLMLTLLMCHYESSSHNI